LVSEDSLDVTEWSVVRRRGHGINVSINQGSFTAFTISPRCCADNLNCVGVVNGEISSVDLRTAVTGIRRLWWVVLGCVIVALGVGFVQESEILSDGPRTYTAVERVYEPVIEVDELGIVGIEPSAIVPVPSFDNQLELLRSDETLDKMRNVTGLSTVVEITRSEPKFTIVNTIDQLNNHVSFLSTGTPSYTYLCYGDTTADCDPMIDALVTETIRLRKESVLAGLTGGLSLLDGLIGSTEETLASSSLSTEERTAQSAHLVELRSKQSALTNAQANITGEMLLISQNTWTHGGTTSSGAASKYAFVGSVGLIIGLLLALQLAAIDRRIRFAWQLERLGNDVKVLGSPYPRSDDSQATSLATALRHAVSAGADKCIIVASDPSTKSFADKILGLVPDVDGVIVRAIESSELARLSSGKNAVLLLALAGTTTRREVLETIGLATTGANHLLGVALVE